MLVHTYYCHSHLGIKQYLKFRFTFKLPLNCINTSNSGNTFKPKFNSLLNIVRTSVHVCQVAGNVVILATQPTPNKLSSNLDKHDTDLQWM